MQVDFLRGHHARACRRVLEGEARARLRPLLPAAFALGFALGLSTALLSRWIKK